MTERPFRRTYLLPSGERRTSATWSIRYYDRRRGRQVREGGFATEAAAKRRLRAQLVDQDRGLDIGARIQRTTWRDLEALVVADYQANRRRSLDRVERSLAHLRDHFGRDARAVEIDEQAIVAYTAARLRSGAKAATVNRELAALRRAFRLAYWSQRVPRVPKIRMLAENNTRKGFFERHQLDAVLKHLPADLHLLVELAHLTGWRWRSELLTREWRHVDLADGWLRLEPGEAKTREGRQFPLERRVLDLLRAHQRATQALEREQGRVVPSVFHRDGEPLNPATVRGAWERATRAAGLPGRLLHDLRRTAVRNLERAGVPRSAAMAMVGHRTESIYRRYAIVDEAMLREAGRRLARRSR